MVNRQNIVAVGLLTQKELDLLGSGFRAAIPIEQATGFEELLAAIDAAEERETMRHRL